MIYLLIVVAVLAVVLLLVRTHYPPKCAECGKRGLSELGFCWNCRYGDTWKVTTMNPPKGNENV